MVDCLRAEKRSRALRTTQVRQGISGSRVWQWQIRPLAAKTFAPLREPRLPLRLLHLRDPRIPVAHARIPVSAATFHDGDPSPILSKSLCRGTFRQFHSATATVAHSLQ